MRFLKKIAALHEKMDCKTFEEISIYILLRNPCEQVSLESHLGPSGHNDQLNIGKIKNNAGDNIFFCPLFKMLRARNNTKPRTTEL